MSKKKILVLCYSDLNSDPRVRRQIKALSDEFEVITSGYSPLRSGNYPFFPIDPSGKFKLIDFHFNKPLLVKKAVSIFIVFKTFFRNLRFFYRQKIVLNLSKVKFLRITYWSQSQKDLFRSLSGIKFDAVLANDMNTLPIAYQISRRCGAKLIFDAHEYSPGENDTNEEWVRITKPIVLETCRKYLPKVDLMFSVCQGIADEYKKEFKMSSVVITNATEFYDLKPSATSSDKIKMIHHGAAIAERHIEMMIEMLSFLDERYTLDLMLVPTQPEYLVKLKSDHLNNPRVNFIEPIEMDQIPVFTNNYDIGLFLLPPTNFNYKFALPNKFFEFVQARLVIAIGPSPEMVTLLKKYDLGVLAEDFKPETLAKKIKELTAEKIMYYKDQCDKHAFELSAENNYRLITESIKRILA